MSGGVPAGGSSNGRLATSSSQSHAITRVVRFEHPQSGSHVRPPRLIAALNGLAIGILTCLPWDILSHAWEPADAALAEHRWNTLTSSP